MKLLLVLVLVATAAALALPGDLAPGSASQESYEDRLVGFRSKGQSLVSYLYHG